MALKSVSGSITITDTNGNQHTVNATDLDFQEVERHSRQLGNEVMYAAEADYGSWSVNAKAWEYPEGDKNHDEISVEGGSYQGRFTFEFEL